MPLYYVSLPLEATVASVSIEPPEDREMPPDDDEFRAAVRNILERSGLSMRALSAAMGRDPGYIAALLDPTRPSRARPTPADLIRTSDATGIAFVELLEALWGIEPSRLADELGRLGVRGRGEGRLDRLTDAERREVADFADFLASREGHRRRR
jgi:transcriptional regulator with XRE-family HTH domain